MDFKDQFIEKLNAHFKDQLFLINVFKDLYNRLEKFKDELEKYSNIGLDVLFQTNNNVVVLTIDDDFLRFEIDWDEDPECIFVFADDVIKEDNPLEIDKIKAIDDGYSAFWNVGIDKAFDYYLKKAFENVL